MIKPDHWINTLKLQPHPEGGFFKETYRSAEGMTADQLPARYQGDRKFSTAIYFLLRSEDRSVFHRIKSDELWHFYDGGTLLIYVLTKDGLLLNRLGRDVNAGDRLQICVPANCWFGAIVEKPNGFALCGCTVAPGFDFADFEMAKRDELLKEYPAYKHEIIQLTKDE